MKAVAEVDLNEELGQDTLVILEFHSPHCTHCKALAPALERLESRYREEVQIISVDTLESADVAARYNVMSVPTLLFFRAGQLKDKVIGNTYEVIVEEKIKKFK